MLMMAGSPCNSLDIPRAYYRNLYSLELHAKQLSN